MRLWQLAVHQASQKLYLSLKTFRGPNQKTLLPQAKMFPALLLGLLFLSPHLFLLPFPIPCTRACTHASSSAQAMWCLAHPKTLSPAE